jgi:hypothetical protein
MVTVFLMTASALLFVVPPSGGAPAAGAWDEKASDITVASGTSMSIESKTWNMNASIHVYGKLYMNNTKLRFGGISDGQFGIYVYNTGSLYLRTCNFTAQDKTTYVYRGSSSAYPGWTYSWGFHWQFTVAGDLDISGGTDLSYIWGNTDTGTLGSVNGGLQIYSDTTKKVVVKDTMIFNCENAGIYIGSGPGTYGSTVWSSSPVISRVLISNITGVGIIAAGNAVKPDIQNCTITGGWYKGGNYYYGAAGTMKNCTFTNNNNFGFCFDPITAGYSMAFYDCKFNDNQNSGAAARRETNARWVNCEFNNNADWGLNIKWVNPDAGGADSSKSTNTVIRCKANYNGKDGIGSNQVAGTADVYDTEISNNAWNGSVGHTAPQVINLYNCDVFDNGKAGIVFHGSGGAVVDCEVHENTDMGIRIETGSVAQIRNTEIHDEEIGIKLISQTGALIEGNDIHDCPVGLDLSKSSPASVADNVFTDDESSIRTDGPDNMFIDNEIVRGSTGFYLAGAKDAKIIGGSIDGTTKGIELSAKATLDIDGTIFTNEDLAMKAVGASVFQITNGSFSNNLIDLELDGASKGTAINTSIPPNKIVVDDADSTFENYQFLDVYVADNFTGQFISQPRVVVKDKDGNNVSDVLGRLDGWLLDQLIPEYAIKGPTVDNNNPMNITVEKEGYIPYWSGPVYITERTFKNVTMAYNYPPIWLDPNINLLPPTTHQRRPTLTWNASWDWNSDIINHHISVYQDEVDDSTFILEATVRQFYVNNDPMQGSINPVYTFTKNLRYNHDFYVVIDSYDPWGLSSNTVAQFRTVNTRPESPVIELLPDPASNLDDISVHFIKNATDVDLDPVDDISYVISFFAMRNGEEQLLQSGGSPVLPSDLTRENDRIIVRVKPFDGIELGLEVSTEVLVINFAPRAMMRYVEIEMTEDTPAVNLVNLSSLFFDEDNDNLVFLVEDEMRHLDIEIDSVLGTNTIIPDADFNGKDYVIISAQDGKIHPNQEWPLVQINATINAVNDPPTLSRVNDLVVKPGKDILLEGTEGAKIVIVPTASDPDGEDIEFSTTMGEDLLGKVNVTESTFSDKTGRIEFFLTNDLVGVNRFNLSASDPTGAMSTATIQLTVENINNPVTMPKITDPKPGVINLTEPGMKIRFTADAADDPDLHIPDSTEVIKYVWDFGDGTRIDALSDEDGTLTIEHQYLNPGEYTVTLTATDNMGLYKTNAITITVEMPEPIPPQPLKKEKLFWEYIPWIILAIVLILGILAVLVFVFRKEPLDEIAISEEMQHEALMAQQASDALKAQEKLAQIMGVSSGPALPGATAADQHEALPAAPVDMQAPPMAGEPPIPAPIPEQAPPAYDPNIPQAAPVEPQPAPPAYMPPQ